MFPKGPNLTKLNIPKGTDPDLIKNLVKKEFIIACIKLVMALLLIIIGDILLFKGIVSDSTIKLTYGKDFCLEFNKAYPGTISIILGFTLALFARINVKIK